MIIKKLESCVYSIACNVCERIDSGKTSRTIKNVRGSLNKFRLQTFFVWALLSIVHT